MQLEYKSFLEFKLADTESKTGVLEGYAARFDNVDLDNEVIERGAFISSLARFKTDGFLAYEHDFRKEIGSINEAFEDERGLYVKAEFYSTPDAQVVRNLLQEKLARGRSPGMSIGYLVKSSEKRNGVRHLLDIDLFEASVVTMPANPQARVAAVKSVADAAEVEQRCAEIRRLYIRMLSKGA